MAGKFLIEVVKPIPVVALGLVRRFAFFFDQVRPIDVLEPRMVHNFECVSLRAESFVRVFDQKLLKVRKLNGRKWALIGDWGCSKPV